MRSLGFLAVTDIHKDFENVSFDGLPGSFGGNIYFLGR